MTFAALFNGRDFSNPLSLEIRNRSYHYVVPGPGYMQKDNDIPLLAAYSMLLNKISAITCTFI